MDVSRTLMAKMGAFCAIVCVGVFCAHSVFAQTIENVATATWQQNGRTETIGSNRVQTALFSPSIVIDTLVNANNNGEPLDIPVTQCVRPGSENINLAIGSTGNSNAIRSDAIRLGQNLIIRIEEAGLNQQATAIEQVPIVLVSSAGDREEIVIRETAANTGLFLGSIPISRLPAAIDPFGCTIEARSGDEIRIVSGDPSAPTGLSSVRVLADPFGIVFDSRSGAPVSGARITLVDAATGAPAQVFAEDGETAWPSTVVSGEPITDAAGNTYPMGAGEYWFPLTSLGNYRLTVDPPAPFTAPSNAPPEAIAQLIRSNGQPFEIADASFGGILSLVDPTPLEIDIPVDAAPVGVEIRKTASKQRVLPGENVFYTIELRNSDPTRLATNLVLEDTAPASLRYRVGALRLEGEEPPEGAVSYSPTGSSFTLALGDLAPGESRRIVYAMSVRPDAPSGQAENKADVFGDDGLLSSASATVRVQRDNIAGRMTIIGRVTAGPCSANVERQGVNGVRVMLEDGSYAITDADGRYHFEGIVPGSHLVRPLTQTLPQGARFTNCEQTVRSLGKADTKLVEGQGGSLLRADFYVDLADSKPVDASAQSAPKIAFEKVIPTAAPAPAPSSASSNALGDTLKSPAEDWLALGDGPDGWLAPALDANPRAPVVKVAIRHRKGQSVRLFAEGEEVSPLSFDGTFGASDGNYAVSVWRGIPLLDERTNLRAEILNSLGGVNQSIERTVYFSSQPANAELVANQSNLIADGQTKPVLAVRITDRRGRPIREGISGRLLINQPYQTAEFDEAQQLQALTGVGNRDARWIVEGDDGVARIELAPTMISGQLDLEFEFERDGIETREFVSAWIAPGDVEWTIIGLAEGSVGTKTIADKMEAGDRFDSDLGKNARLALYAKGRILGRYLVTLAYDSAKQEDDQPLLGALDPNAYYTVFGDGSSRRFDAASQEKLYLRVESARFNAVYGDFQTGFTQTRLGRYQRTATGLTAQARVGDATVGGFAAKIGSTFQRDEFQGNGLSGPYTLSQRDIITNGETVILEVRDRFRPEIIISSLTLTRFTDYDIDLASGTITFVRPILSRDADLNPQFIIVEYETFDRGGGEWNAGARIDYEGLGQLVNLGATVISDSQEGVRTNVLALDAEVALTDSTQLRGEVAVSESQGNTSTGWLVEAQHQSGALDLLAYAQSISADFGEGRISGAEVGRMKFGLDGNLRLNDEASILANAFQDQSLTSDVRRRALRTALNYRMQERDLQLGLARFEDRLTDGSIDISTLLEASANQRLFDSKLQIGMSTSFALEGPDSRDLPNRHSIDLRYAFTPDIRLIGNYELADGNDFNADTFRLGFEMSPWQGAQISSAFGSQSIGEDPNRTFAAYGLSQSLQVSESLTIDASVDGNMAMSDAPPIEYATNLGQPLANGSPIGQGGGFVEDFTAVTIGGTWRRDHWNITGRGEYRNATSADRWGIILGAFRQLGGGSIAGGRFSWTNASNPAGTSTQVIDGALSFAYRPSALPLSILGKLEYRSDIVIGALPNGVSPLGRTALFVDGDASSERLIASVSTNWSPGSKLFSPSVAGRHEFGLFLGARYGTDVFEGQSLTDFTTLLGADARLSVNEVLDLGASGNVRIAHSSGLTSYSYGPFASIKAAEGMVFSIGHNFEGFTDADFEAAREVRQGPWASIQLAFDENLFGL